MEDREKEDLEGDAVGLFGNKNSKAKSDFDSEAMKKEVWGEKVYEQDKIWNKVTEYNLKIIEALKQKDFTEAKKLCRLGIKWCIKFDSIASLNYPFIALSEILEKQQKYNECIKIADEYLSRVPDDIYFSKLKIRLLEQLKP